MKNYIILFVILLTTYSCEWSLQRNCPVFNAEINNWKESDEDIGSMAFLNSLDTITFELDSIVLNEEFTAFETAGSSNEEDVTCRTFKKYYYSSNELNIQLNEEFHNEQNTFRDGTAVEYFIKELDNGTVYQIANIPIAFNDETFIQTTEIIDSFSHFGIIYQNVHLLNIEFVFNINLNQQIDTNYFTKLFFKPSIGLIGFDKVDGERHIRIK